MTMRHGIRVGIFKDGSLLRATILDSLPAVGTIIVYNGTVYKVIRSIIFIKDAVAGDTVEYNVTVEEIVL